MLEFFNETTVGNVKTNFAAERSGRFSPMVRTLTKERSNRKLRKALYNNCQPTKIKPCW